MTALFIGAEANRVSVKLQCRIEPDLEADIVPVNLNSAGADMELIRRVLAGMPLGDQLKDLEFPVGESMDMGVIKGLFPVPVATGKRLDGLPDDLGVEIEFPAQDCFDCLFEATHRIHLVKIPEGTGPDAALRIELLVVVGIDQDLQIGIERLEMLDELEAILPVQLDLQDHEIGWLLLHLLDSLLGRGAGPDDIPMTQLLDVVGETDPTGRLGIDDGNPSPSFWG